MKTKKKTTRPRPRPRSSSAERFEEQQAEHRLAFDALMRRIGGLEQQIAQLAIAGRDRRVRVFVVLIGEFLRRSRTSEPLGTPDWAASPERDEPARLERGFLSGCCMVPETSADPHERVQVRIEDRQHRLWAPGAWLIAFNGATLSNICVGDMAEGNGIEAPIAQLSHPIKPGIVVQASVRLETWPEWRP